MQEAILELYVVKAVEGAGLQLEGLKSAAMRKRAKEFLTVFCVVIIVDKFLNGFRTF